MVYFCYLRRYLGISLLRASLCCREVGEKETEIVTSSLACVASASVWFRGKEILRKGTFGFDCARNETGAKLFYLPTFLAVFDSPSSFFSPKPYRNACYAGYVQFFGSSFYFYWPGYYYPAGASAEERVKAIKGSLE